MPLPRTLTRLASVCCLVIAGTAVASPDTPVDPRAKAAMDQIAKKIDAHDKASADVRHFVKARLLPICANKVLVDAVKAQNAKQRTLAEIQAIDHEWVNAEDFLPIHDEMLSGSAAEAIKTIAKSHPALGETFLMDNQGANVAQNELTSDFWQGDEAKWKEAFAAGKGGVHFSSAKLDESTNSVDQKVSLPIFDVDGTVIGAICFGIKPDQVGSAVATETP